MAEKKTQTKRYTHPELGELHPREVSLLLSFRHQYRYGEVTVAIVDGIPKQLIKTVKRKNL